MKIGQIREVIDLSGYVRNDLAGHTRDEFMRRNVPELLVDMVEKLEALEIAPRFAEDEARRQREIGYCKLVIERWCGLHGTAVA